MERFAVGTHYPKRLLPPSIVLAKDGFFSGPSLASDLSDADDFIKDPYVLEFLNLPEDLSGKESLLEAALISNLQQFLLELGKGFSFVARQMRISTETSHFYLEDKP